MADRGARTPAELDDVDYLRFSWADIHGISRAKIVPIRYVSKYWKEGVRTYVGHLGLGPRSEVVKLPDTRNDGNVVSKPDPASVYTLPWAGGPTTQVGAVLCDVYWEGGPLQGACTRAQARRQIELLYKDHGLRFMSSFENEFMLLDAKTEKPVYLGCDVFTNLVFSEMEQFFFAADKLLVQARVDIEIMHSEYSSGQYECALAPKFGIESPDAVFKFKEGLKEISLKSGYMATFMTKPFSNEYTNACHLNHSVWDDNGRNAFHDATDADHLSDTFRYWMAGLLKHAAALTALCCPTWNCYRRLHHIWCPHLSDWGIDNRNACFRAKNYSPEGTYIECRLTSAAHNPYISVAATIACGMDGLKNKLALPPQLQKDAPELPHCLEEALIALEQDEVLKAALGEEFISWFISAKRQIELEKCKEHSVTSCVDSEYVTEREMYLKFI